MCVQPSLLTALISWASVPVVIVTAGQRGKAPTLAVVFVSDRSQPQILRPICTPTHDTVKPLTDKFGATYAISYSNLIQIDAGPFIQEFSKHFKVMFLNDQSVRNKALDICDYFHNASDC